MKITKYILGIVILATCLFTSCQKYNTIERKVYPNQSGFKKLIPYLDAKSEEDLTPSQRAYFAKIRAYHQTAHVRGFGWFGNWTGKGSNPQNYLKALPDSVDFVSLWGPHGSLSKEQMEDLNFFQKIKGGKALLCWIVSSIGDQITPAGTSARDYWYDKLGKGNKDSAVVAYANAICDTIEKYNLDGFDIDYEPGYGSDGDLANSQTISPNGNSSMFLFIKTLYNRLNPKGKWVVMDGQPDLLSTEASKMVRWYIYQAYWNNTDTGVLYKINRPNLDQWEAKTIITAEFEQGWSTGGITYYSSSKDYVNAIPGNQGRQLCAYSVFDLPNGKRIAGIGTYHMEYDYANTPHYKFLRKALNFGNVLHPGKFQ